MKFEKRLTPISKLAEWGLKGIYNEYGLERSFCGCGYVTDRKIYVCPECGNTEFHPIKDYNGHIIEKPATDICFELNPTDNSPMLTLKHKWLRAKRSAKDPADMELSETEVSEVVFRLANYHRTSNVDTESLRAAIRKYAKKFCPELEKAVPIMDAIEYPLERANEFLNLTNDCSFGFMEIANELLESGETVLLRFLIEKHRKTAWKSVDDELYNAGVPRFLWGDRNNLNALNAFAMPSYYGRATPPEDVELKWAKMPMDIQNSILLYLRQGLITNTQMQSMVFFDENLLKESPEAMAKVIRKYFANFQTGSYRGYGRYGSKATVTDMYEFYKEEGFPVTPETFDFRSWRAAVNSKTVHEAGYDPSTVDGILEGMDKSPIDTILALGKLRRPRRKKTP